VLNAGTGLPPALVARIFEEAGATVHHGQGAGASEDRYAGLAVWARERIGAAQLAELLPRADVLLVGGESASPGAAVPGSPGDLARRHPSLVVLSIEGYLPGVPEPTPAVDLLVQARTGMAWEMFSDRPTPIAFAPTLYGSALLGSLGVWAALIDREATGRGQVVRVTLQQGGALFWSHLWMLSETPDREFDKVPPLDVRHLIFRCGDGRYVQLVLGVPSALSKVYNALGINLPVDPAERGAPDPARGPADYFARRQPIADAVRSLSSAEVLERLVAAGVPASLAAEVGAAIDSPQARVNGMVRSSAGGDRWGASPVDVTPVPKGQREASAAGRLAPWRPTGTGAGPLEGLKVVDFGNWVAGPFSSKLLADLGADVVSVDPPQGLSNLTGIRNVLSSNRGKRSAVVDLKTPEGVETLTALASSADVVCHNFRVGVAERLGLGPEALRAANPLQVYLHTSAFGESGPWAQRGGFDMVGQAIGGHELRAGGQGNEPLWTRSPFIDYGTGALGAIAVLAALYARLRTGEPQEAHVSLLGTALFMRSDCYVDSSGNARGQLTLDKERLGFSPWESLYRTSDSWIALYVPDQASADSLGRLAGLRPAARRTGWGEAERAAISRWTGERETGAVLEELAAAGVWAAESRRGEWHRLGASRYDTGDPFVIEVSDPRFGLLRGVFGPQIHLARYPVRISAYLSAPLAGAHTDEVLASLADEHGTTDLPLPGGGAHEDRTQKAGLQPS
jgi:crotonobetainyl-CoA:carnitine CoA-transferase CaiB-like acyl-CoA transferase